MKIYAAPLQGFTEAPWRSAHARVFGGADCYFTPFIRVEGGGVRRRDMADAVSELNEGVNVVPQAIFSGVEELRIVVDLLRSHGINRVDLNMGCPFPPQCRKGRGAALLVRKETVADVARYVTSEAADISFSVKMRIGLDRPDQWREVMPLLNAMPLHHIAVHPRMASQQYSGEIRHEEFAALLGESAHPVIFNGDLDSVEKIREVHERYPSAAGVMIGRGLLAQPHLAALCRGEEVADPLAGALEMHDMILKHYAATLCGQSQVLAKIKPFWEYLEGLAGRKACKVIRKAGNMERYLQAVEMIGR